VAEFWLYLRNKPDRQIGLVRAGGAKTIVISLQGILIVARYCSSIALPWSLPAKLFLLLFFAATPVAAQADMSVVVNSDVPVQSISQYNLRAIFGMRKRSWKDGEAITVYVLSDDSPLHVEFSKKVLGIFPHQLRRSWDYLVFSGLGQAPIEVESKQEMLRRVEQTPGWIGYLDQPQEDENVRSIPIK